MNTASETGRVRTVVGVAIGIVVVLIALAAVVVSMQPSTFTISRSAVSTASPADLFAAVNDFHRWEAWNPWGKLDPAMKQSYDGAPQGVGAKYGWVGNNQVGEGRMTITESVPNERIRIHMEFLKPMAGTSEAEFTFTPEGNGTKIIWSMSGSNNFMAKAMGLIMDMDKMIGGQFEKGLTDLKAAAESKS